jgi:8-oxoguanine deaminase
MVVHNGVITELVPKGGKPKTANVTILEAGQHVIVPGLINTHHLFYQPLTRAVVGASQSELFEWLKTLYPIWSRPTPDALESGVTTAMASLLLSGCTTTTDHHYVFPPALENAIDIEVRVARRLGMRA